MTSLTNLKDFWCITFWLLKLTIVSLLLLWHLTSLAIYTETTAKTNVNTVDPLFNEKIENYKEFEQVVEGQKEAAVKGVESEVGFSALVGGDEARTKASNLSNISAEELEGAGFRESAKEAWINDYLVDYSKPGMMLHKKDAESITEATGKMLDGLIGMLKKLDIDCKQVKGNKEIEPQYYIQVSKELDRNKGDTVYDKIICETLRNSYNCKDHLAMNCSNKGIIWGPWQARTIAFSGTEMTSLHSHWFYKVFWKKYRKLGRRKTVYSLHVINNPAVMAEARVAIASKLGVSLDHINQSVTIPYQGQGNLTEGWNSEVRKWDHYVFYYQYRDGHPACLQRQEEWREKCLPN